MIFLLCSLSCLAYVASSVPATTWRSEKENRLHISNEPDSHTNLDVTPGRNHAISMHRADLVKILGAFLLSTSPLGFHGASRQVGPSTNTRAVASRLKSVRMQAALPRMGADLKRLLASNRLAVDSLKPLAPDMSEVALLRFVLAFPNKAEAQRAVRERLRWEKGAGRNIVESAASAVAEATSGGGWDNAPVAAAAPNAARIGNYITPKSVLTMSTNDGDLIYVIRASAIDDKALMSRVSSRELSDFLLYAKEVHSLVADARSSKTGRLCRVIFANDITGVVGVPDSRFQNALTGSSQEYEKLYPCLAGPTMILNLPFFLQVFVNLFKPLFPPSLQDRLLFDTAPVLAGLRDLAPLATNSRSRVNFLNEIKKLTRMS